MNILVALPTSVVFLSYTKTLKLIQTGLNPNKHKDLCKSVKKQLTLRTDENSYTLLSPVSLNRFDTEKFCGLVCDSEFQFFEPWVQFFLWVELLNSLYGFSSRPPPQSQSFTSFMYLLFVTVLSSHFLQIFLSKLQ